MSEIRFYRPNCSMCISVISMFIFIFGLLLRKNSDSDFYYNYYAIFLRTFFASTRISSTNEIKVI